MTEAETILDKARGKIQLARKLEAEASGLAKQAKGLQKEAANHRSEAERLLMDNEQTEMPLAIVKWKCQACDATFTTNPGEMHQGEAGGKKYSCGPVLAVERQEGDDAEGGDVDDDEPELDADEATVDPLEEESEEAPTP